MKTCVGVLRRLVAKHGDCARVSIIRICEPNTPAQHEEAHAKYKEQANIETAKARVIADVFEPLSHSQNDDSAS
ncbi:MAG: hypothetical protein SGPRY_011228 [Prymnesium sp.]